MKSFFLLFSMLCLLSACDNQTSNEPQAKDDGKLTIITSFYPTTWLVETITSAMPQEDISIQCPLPKGEDAIYWKPDQSTIQMMQQADLIILNGAEFEKWPGYVMLPSSRTLSTASVFKDQWVKYESALVHKHGAGGEHSHEGTDGHTWVDPVLFRLQAKEIYERIKSQVPAEQHKQLAQGWQKAGEALDQLASQFSQLPTGKTPILASHPAYNYPAKRYGWQIVNLDLDPESPLSDEQLKDIEEKLKNHPAKIMLWESEPLAEIAKQLQDKFELKSVVFSPLENPDEVPAGGYDAAMAEDIADFKNALAATKE